MAFPLKVLVSFQWPVDQCSGPLTCHQNPDWGAFQPPGSSVPRESDSSQCHILMNRVHSVYDAQGKELHGATEGILALKQAWPSAIRTVKGDHRRFEETYFATFPVSHPPDTLATTAPLEGIST